MEQPLSRHSSTGFGTTLLQIAFIVLKLTGTITWSWWWVLSPMWIMTLLALLVIAVEVGIAAFQDKTNFR
jgi:transmembrane Fragile-X-F protein